MTEERTGTGADSTDLTRLNRALQDVSSLKDIAAAMNSTMSVEEITGIAIDQSLRRVGASQGAVFLLSEDARGIDNCRTFIRRIEPGTNELPFSLNMELLGWMLKHKAKLVSNDPKTDKRFRSVQFEKLGIRSLIAVPLTSMHGLLGALVLFNKPSADFDDDDAGFLEIVVVQTAKIIENVGLFRKEMAVQQELKMAQEIQQRFLPRQIASGGWYDVCAVNKSAREVGGDFYDLFVINPDTLFFSIGDVSGKGVPAALVMANAQAVVRSHLFGVVSPDLGELIGKLNRLVHDLTTPGQYVTAFYGILNRADLRIQFVNAGHLPAFIVRTGEIQSVGDDSDPVIGVLPDYAYRTQVVSMKLDETLLLYTDGVTECTNRAGEMYESERLQEVLIASANLPLTSLSENLQNSLNDFRQDAEQSDDITYLGLRPHS